MAVKIHIVEDSAQLRSYLIDAVGRIHETEISGYSDDADLTVRMIELEQPAVVVLDLSLREGHGINVLRQIKRKKSSPAVVVLTNYATDFYRSRAMQYGADYFFDKSLEFDKALETIAALVENERKKHASEQEHA